MTYTSSCINIRGISTTDREIPLPTDLYLDTSFLLDIYTPSESSGFYGLQTEDRIDDCLEFVRRVINNDKYVYVSEFALSEAFRKLLITQVDHSVNGAFVWAERKSLPRKDPNFNSWYKRNVRSNQQGFLDQFIPIYDDLLEMLSEESIMIMGMHYIPEPLLDPWKTASKELCLQAPDALHVAIAQSFPPCTALATCDKDYRSIPGIQVYHWK